MSTRLPELKDYIRSFGGPPHCWLPTDVRDQRMGDLNMQLRRKERDVEPQ